MSNLPFKAYEGDEQYIFISYAHKNSEKVFPIIKQLDNMGYRIWYDEGIDPGSEWPESIAEHLSKAAAVMLFITPESMDSDNVRREITYALNFRKMMLSIFLLPTEMSPGMLLQLGLIQAIHYYTYNTDDLFFEKLLKSIPFEIKREKEQEVTQKQSFFKNPFTTPKQIELNIPVENETGIVKNIEPLKFNPEGIVLPFVTKGTATINLKAGVTLTVPVNTLIVPKDEGNFAGLSIENNSVKSNYLYGITDNFYSFEDMKSFEVSVFDNKENKLGIVIYMIDGTKHYKESKYDFILGILAGKNYRTISLSDITSVQFDHGTHLNNPANLALVTTIDKVSFYTPIAMLATSQYALHWGNPYYKRNNGIESNDRVIDFKKLKSVEIKAKTGNMFSNGNMTLSFIFKSGMDEEVHSTPQYMPSLIGVNQYGCFSLPFTKLARIDIFESENDSAPKPTPLPFIKWPEMKNTTSKFYGEGLARITTSSGEQYECPANAVYAIDIVFTKGLHPYIDINTTIKDSVLNLFSGRYSGDACTPFTDIQSINIRNKDNRYLANIKDLLGITISGSTNLINRNSHPAFVCPKNGKQGAIRLVDLKELFFDHDAEAPAVNISTIYSIDGKSIDIPKGCISFANYSLDSYPSTCFRLPTGNYIEIDRLKRMMIYSQKSENNENIDWLIFECDGFSGAFPLEDKNMFTIYGMDSLGLRTLKAGADWIIIDTGKE